MGFEIRITGSTPLESLSMLAAAANYCMYVPVVREAANDILAGDKSAATPGPQNEKRARAGASVASPAGAASAPGSAASPGMNPSPAGAAPAASPGVVPNQNQAAPNGYPGNGAAQNPMPPNNCYGYPVNPQNQPPVGAQGGAQGNPTMGEIGANPAMTIPTSPSNPQQYIPGMAPTAGNAPGPGAGQLPVSNAPSFTVAQVSKAGADLVTANPAKRAEVNALLRQYGVQTLNELKQNQLGPFAMALRGMGANI